MLRHNSILLFYRLIYHFGSYVIFVYQNTHAILILRFHKHNTTFCRPTATKLTTTTMAAATPSAQKNRREIWLVYKIIILCTCIHWTEMLWVHTREISIHDTFWMLLLHWSENGTPCKMHRHKKKATNSHSRRITLRWATV